VQILPNQKEMEEVVHLLRKEQKTQPKTGQKCIRLQEGLLNQAIFFNNNIYLTCELHFCATKRYVNNYSWRVCRVEYNLIDFFSFIFF